MPDPPLNASLTREAILKKHPWLETRGLPCVLGDDLDSIMSGVLMHHLLEWKVVGFYEKYQRVWYLNSLDPQNLRDAVWLDLDISREYIKSIGHHVLMENSSNHLPSHVSSVNPNLFRGVTGQPGKGSARDHGAECLLCDGMRFPHKYPLGTIHFLLWLYDVELPIRGLHEAAIIWLPDSSWINGQSHKYRLNVLDWVQNWIRHSALFLTVEKIDSQEFEITMRDDVFSRLEKIGFARGKGQVQSRFLRLGGYQCQFSNPNVTKSNIQELANLISEIFCWSRLEIPENYTLIKGRRNPESYDLSKVRKIYGGLPNFLTRENVFSYVIPNNGKINYTKDVLI